MTSECPVCMVEKRLRVGTCKSKHCFCTDCLNVLARQHGHHFPCPVCRQPMSITRGCVSKLPWFTPDEHVQLPHADDKDTDDVRVPRARPGGRRQGVRQMMAILVHPSPRRNVPPVPRPQVTTGSSDQVRVADDTLASRSAFPSRRQEGAGPFGAVSTYDREGAARPTREAVRPTGRDDRQEQRGRVSYPGDPASTLSEDELLAFALQEAEFQSPENMRSMGSNFDPYGGASHYRNQRRQETHVPTASSLDRNPRGPGSYYYCPVHGVYHQQDRPYYRDGNKQQFQKQVSNLSDEELAFRMQEDELRLAGHRSRQHDDDDDDDKLALKFQEEEIQAAKQLERDRQVAEGFQDYDRGVLSTQMLNHKLQKQGGHSGGRGVGDDAIARGGIGHATGGVGRNCRGATGGAGRSGGVSGDGVAGGSVCRSGGDGGVGDAPGALSRGAAGVGCGGATGVGCGGATGVGCGGGATGVGCGVGCGGARGGCCRGAVGNGCGCSADPVKKRQKEMSGLQRDYDRGILSTQRVVHAMQHLGVFDGEDGDGDGGLDDDVLPYANSGGVVGAVIDAVLNGNNHIGGVAAVDDEVEYSDDDDDDVGDVGFAAT